MPTKDYLCAISKNFVSFGEEDFQRFALNKLCSNCFVYYLVDNVGGATNLNKHAQGLFLSKYKNTVQQFCRRRFSKVLH